MLIKIKHDQFMEAPIYAMTALQRGAQAASSMKRQKLYANAARAWLRAGKLHQARHMLSCWHHERAFWAHVMGVAV